MKYIDENKVIYNKAIKNGNFFHILKRDWETIPFAIDQAPVINSLFNNQRYWVYRCDPSQLYTKSKSTTKKNSDKEQQTQNIKNLILETLQDTTSIITTELVHHKQKTIDTLILIIEKMTTYPSNVPTQLTPLEEREEPEKQHQHELQFRQEGLT